MLNINFRSLITIGLVALALQASQQAIAQQASTQAPSNAEVEQMLVALKLDQQMNAMLPQMQSFMKSNMEQMLRTQMSDGQREQFNKTMDDAHKMVQEEMAWPKLKPVFVKIYADTLTREEVLATTAFYSTPVGASMLDKMPLLMQRSMQAMQTEVMPNLMKRFDQMIKQPKK